MSKTEIIAPTASAALFFDPLVLAIACLWLLQLKTQLATGFKFCIEIFNNELVIVLAITSLWVVWPLIIHPIARTPSYFSFLSFIAIKVGTS